MKNTGPMLTLRHTECAVLSNFPVTCNLLLPSVASYKSEAVVVGTICRTLRLPDVLDLSALVFSFDQPCILNIY